MATEPLVGVGRLTFRAEGEVINARWAPEQNTMEGAVLLGSISRLVCDGDPTVFTRFTELMKSVLHTIIRDAVGYEPKWEEKPAPEHEKAGRA